MGARDKKPPAAYSNPTVFGAYVAWPCDYQYYSYIVKSTRIDSYMNTIVTIEKYAIGSISRQESRLIISVTIMSPLAVIATCVWSEPPNGPPTNELHQITLWVLRYACVAIHPLSHFPHTLDTDLYFKSEISGSDLVAAELPNRPGAFQAFFLIAAILQAEFIAML